MFTIPSYPIKGIKFFCVKFISVTSLFFKKLFTVSVAKGVAPLSPAPNGIPDVIDGQEEYSKIEKAWDNLDRSEQKSIIDDVLSGEARPDEYEKSFDQLSDENEEFESAIKNYLGLDEQNMTNTGVSFTAGDGEGYATPSAFAKPGQWKRKNEKYEE